MSLKNAPPLPPLDSLEPQFEMLPPLPPRDQLSGHEYDGIQEYDNPTPGWWTAVFAISVLFAGLYFVYYHSGVPERSIYDSYDAATVENSRKILVALGIKDLTVTPTNLMMWTKNKDYMSYGQGIFKANCVGCHGSNGEGLVGPNLTDDYYKNVHRIMDIPRVVVNGAANGAMPAWGQRLGNVDVALVSAYVASLRGKNLSGPRAIEGDKAEPWPEAPAATMPAESK